MKKTRPHFSRSRLNQAIALALLTAAASPAMAGSGSCADGSNTISGAETSTCFLEPGDSLNITGSGSITDSGHGIYVYGGSNSISNSGTVDAGDQALYLYGAAVSGNVTNSGTLDASGAGVYVYGSSSISGNFTNSGTITGNHGIYVYGIGDGAGTGGLDIGGNFTNSGLIEGSYAGIYVYGSSLDITGNFVNSGTIDAGGSGIYVYAGAGGSFSVGGDIINSGLIDASYHGIYLYGANIDGDVVNSGTINAGDSGIYVYGSVAGDIVNSGTIDAGDDGIYISNTGAAAKSISNTGTILSGDMGIRYAGNVTGSVTNSGLIDSSDEGLYLTDGFVGGNVVNSGTIDSGDIGIYIDMTTVAGNVENSGTILSEDQGIYIYGAVDGDIINSGLIHSDESGMYIYGSTVGGDIVNSGTIISDDSRGIYIYGGNTIGGSVINSGVIHVDDTGIYIYDEYGSIAGDVVNSGTITADDYRGIYLYGNVAGDVINTGTIEASATSGYDYASIYVYGGSVIGGEINNSGTLLGHIQIDADVDVTNSGLIHSKDEESYVESNYTQTADGTFRFNADDAATFGYLDVDDDATFAVGTTLSVDAQSGNTLADGNVLNNVVTAGNLDASTINVTDNLLALRFIPAIDGNTVDLTAADTGLTTVQAAGVGGEAGAVIDGLMDLASADYNEDVAFAIGSASTVAELERAVEGTMPALGGGVSQASLGFLTSFDGLVGDRQAGIASGDQTLINRNFWFKGYGSAADQGRRDGVSGYDVDSLGMAFGVDGEISSTWTVGAAGSYTKSDVDSKVAIGSHDIDVKTIFGKAYATNRLDSDTAVNLQAGIGFSDFDSRREVAGGAVASADYDARHFRASAEWVRNYQHSSNSIVSPYVRAEYRYVDVDGYTETGAGGLNLDVDDDSADSLILGVGVRGSHTTSNNWVLTGDVGIGYDAMTDESSLTASYQGTGAQFSVDGMEPSKVVYNLGLGAKYELDNGTEIRAGYDLNGRKDFTDQSLSVKARWKF